MTAVAFSFAGGIFHPYYVSFLAPFAAALVGATFAQARRRRDAPGRVLGALAIGAGAITEIVVIGNGADRTRLAGAADRRSPRGRRASFSPRMARRQRAGGPSPSAGALGVLLIGPAIWSVETLGHPTSGTFPAGGPASAPMGGPGGGPAGCPAEGGGPAGRRECPDPGAMPGAPVGIGEMPGLGEGMTGPPGMAAGAIPGLEGAESGLLPEAALCPKGAGALAESGSGKFGAIAGGPGGMLGGAGTEASPRLHRSPRRRHDRGREPVRGRRRDHRIRGRSGRHRRLLRQRVLGQRRMAGRTEIEAGNIRWILSGGTAGGFGGGAPAGAPTGAQVGTPGGDTRTGSESALDKVTATCEAVESTTLESSSGTLYDCSTLS